MSLPIPIILVECLPVLLAGAAAVASAWSTLKKEIARDRLAGGVAQHCVGSGQLELYLAELAGGSPSSRTIKEVEALLSEAIQDLPEEERARVLEALNQPSAKGKLRYMATVLEKGAHVPEQADAKETPRWAGSHGTRGRTTDMGVQRKW